MTQLHLYLCYIAVAAAGPGYSERWMAAHGARVQTLERSDVMSELRQRVRNLQGPPLSIFDVGANDGKWSRDILKECVQHRRATAVDLFLLEPQPQFYASLDAIARAGTDVCRVHVVRRAAWVRQENLTFWEARSRRESVSASLNRQNVRRSQRSFKIEAIPFDSFLKKHVAQGAQGVLKLDIESAEYLLLPHLLRTRALCQVKLFVIEWHLVLWDAARKAESLALIRDFDKLLEGGCSAAGIRPTGAAVRRVHHMIGGGGHGQTSINATVSLQEFVRAFAKPA